MGSYVSNPYGTKLDPAPSAGNDSKYTEHTFAQKNRAKRKRDDDIPSTLEPAAPSKKKRRLNNNKPMSMPLQIADPSSKSSTSTSTSVSSSFTCSEYNTDDAKSDEMTKRLLAEMGNVTNQDLMYKWDDICAIIGDYKLMLQCYLKCNPSLSTAEINKIIKVIKKPGIEFTSIAEAVLLTIFSYFSYKEISILCRTSKYIKSICESTTPSLLSFSDIKHIKHRNSMYKFTKIQRFFFDFDDVQTEKINEFESDLTFVNKLFAKKLENLTHIISDPSFSRVSDIKFNMDNYPELLVFDGMIHWNYPSLPPKLRTLSVDTIKYEYIPSVNNIQCIKFAYGLNDEDQNNLYDQNDGHFLPLDTLDIKQEDSCNKLKYLLNTGYADGDALEINFIFIANNRKSLEALHIAHLPSRVDIGPIYMPNLKSLCLCLGAGIGDVGECLRTPNVITMACRSCYDDTRYTLVGTLQKLQITKLKFIRLIEWSWKDVYGLLRNDEFLTQCIEYPFCVELFDMIRCKHGDMIRCLHDDFTKHKLLAELYKNVDKKIKIKHKNRFLGYEYMNIKVSDDDTWELYDNQKDIQCELCSPDYIYEMN